ncbi:anaphase-promoting complex TPR lobe subcomplex subunit Apc3 [Schizosaccharomyces pombe]|uniref:Anaphase-promoting complex subunit 3 n=1 Tax=Schizosaccharomyces pombe (strain 972 / ATCC 24843) TaxID=284812 RepID=APC3_SCHPO|nr:anaphase-promoting complex subunit Apc3 [Schizosaccharomyces pombe]P10505.3 RecName: Full=Anaphase-promoting complex subunit 3; AltName: Full=20S cyclosome/APC complex protein apc3; AltName: Full=Nuclear alteration protein 2; AltName: Full=Nuclear scaffold-like protein p76 [Schizosaccharomyces pombe 972h-]CAA97347.2 anaphase-promoting complex subunit Apc3 [Schizosaccharomyces pombe]|eukprot:NP_594604.2 anaphase-promoting complex subunit Apc3 [Schizosaccharomyces pombe]
MTDRLKCLIWYCIDNQNYDNSIFYSERLHAIEDSNESLYLLAYSHFLNLDYNIVYDLLDRVISHVPCTYLFARTSLILGRYKQGISAVEACRSNWRSIQPNINDSISSRGHPDASCMLDVLGTMYKKAGFLKKATDCFVEAVSINPYNFSAFQNLTAIGVPLDANNVFVIPPYLTAMKGFEKSQTNATASVPEPSFLKKSKESSSSSNKFSVSESIANSYSNSSISAFTKWFDRVDASELPGSEKERHQSLKLQSQSQTSKNLLAFNDAQKADSNNRDTSLKSHFVEPRTQALRPGARLTYKLREARSSKRGESTPQSFREEDNNLMELLKLFGKGVYLLAQYKLREALNCFQSLPIEQQNTPFVLAKLGITYFELVDYEKSEEVFQKLRDLSPSRVKDMEVFSTALWHLQKSVPLSYLAHETLETNPYSPESWCILANCFSLQREHSQALKCINRAIQLDPTFEYAYTLQGHEHSANEEYEKSKTSFRKAIRVNVRHYNAWYGLGMVYLKTGRNDQADFHFQRAAEINPNNSVLITCIGMIYERCKDYKKALDFYDRACKLDEKSSLARFKKAKVLILLHDHDKALVELEQLKAIAPDEANVHFLLGKIFKQMRKKNLALKHFTIAWNLDGKATHIIKESIENLDIPEENLLTETGEIYRNLET